LSFRLLLPSKPRAARSLTPDGFIANTGDKDCPPCESFIEDTAAKTGKRNGGETTMENLARLGRSFTRPGKG
jgi:hypothetical protein